MEKLETLWGGMTMETGAAFPLSTDSMLLADFAPVFSGCRAADLGSGSGALGLLLCGKEAGCTVRGLEISEAAHEAALRNIRRNGLEARMESCLGDLREIRSLFPHDAFDLVVSNPPYFTPGRGKNTADPGLRTARQEEHCSLAQLFEAAAWLLPTGGKFCLVHRPERLTDLLWEARNHGLEPKVLRLVRHHPGTGYNLILLQCRRGGKPGLQLLPDLVLYGQDGSPTPETRKIYHL